MSVYVVCLGLACVLLCSRWVRVGAAPICSDMQASCQIASLADLFERVLQHSARLHTVSSDLHSDFVSLHYYLHCVRIIIVS